MGNITLLSRGSLNGLRRQTNECLKNAYNKGYEDGKKEPREVKAVNVEDTSEYQIGYKVGYADGKKELRESHGEQEYNRGIEDASNLLAYADEKFIRECFPSESNWNWFDLNAKYGLALLIKEFKKWQEQKKQAEEFKVGDIVKFNKKCHGYETKENREFLVLHKFDNGIVTLLYDNGDTGAVDISLLDKTDRHIDETEQLLDKLKGNK
jgi:hypothetical protein